MPKITLVIPMYNESKIIKDTAITLYEYMNANFEDYEIIFSDDGSKDGCGDIVKDLNFLNVNLISQSVNEGKGSAVRRAMLQASGDIVIFTDADLAYGTDIIKQIYDEMTNNSNVDVLIGSRNIFKDGYDGYTFIRKIASRLYIKMIGAVAGFKFSDSQCGCKAFSSEAAKSVFSRCEVNGFAFDLEAILWAQKLNFKVEEIPVKIINHRYSKVHVFKDSFKMLKDANAIRKKVKRASILQK